MNKVLLIGRLTREPELQDIAGDMKICKFGLAVNKRFKKDSEQNADFFNVIAWNKQAELCKKYIDKGSKVAIAGRIEIDKWQDKEGNNRYSTNIIVEEIEFLSSKNENEASDSPPKSKPERQTPKQSDADDLPF